ncbi:MAG: cytochrome P450 [Acidimicrobiales bacterium]|nr:cytochrome P450 [Acidimicrobiales bacterium]MCB9372131.1 cytochrome P450 [Microthrixaceae bacterium]
MTDVAAPAGAGHPDEHDLDLLDGALYAGDPEPTYAWLREHAPVYWDATNRLWGVSRYADIVAIEKDPATFTSSLGFRPNTPGDTSMIGLDDPLHTSRRRLVSRRFTPRAAGGYEDDVRRVVTDLIDAVATRGECEVVEDLAAPLPAMMIGWLLGFDDDQWPSLKHWSETTIPAGGGPRYLDDDIILAAAEFHAAAAQLAAVKRERPGDDCMTVWTTAEVDGAPLTDDDIVSEALLLLDGGAETTRNVIAAGIWLLSQHPDQRQLLVDDPSRLPTAVEELIRYVTPILNMRRTATRDVELHGQLIREGDEVLLMYSSANRDEAVFDDPQRFDVTRSPNNHIAFGFGTHFCLGASLARLELRVFFEELLRRLPDIGPAPGVTAPEIVPGAFVRGIRALPAVFTPEPA